MADFESSGRSRLDELTLAEPDGQTPSQVLGESAVKLPLPEQDRELAKKRIQRNRMKRMSILELMAFMFLLCLLLAMSRWFTFEVYTVGLGCATVILLLFEKILVARYRMIAIFTLLSAYLISAVWLIIRG